MAIPAYDESLSVLENGEILHYYIFNHPDYSILDFDQDQQDAYAAFITDASSPEFQIDFLVATYGADSPQATDEETFWASREPIEEDTPTDPHPSTQAPEYDSSLTDVENGRILYQFVYEDGGSILYFNTEQKAAYEAYLLSEWGADSTQVEEWEAFWNSQDQYEGDPSTDGSDGIVGEEDLITPTDRDAEVTELSTAIDSITDLKASIQENVKKDLTKLMALKGVVQATGADCCVSDKLSEAYNYLAKACNLDLVGYPKAFVTALGELKELWDSARAAVDEIVEFFQNSAIVQGAREMINGAESLIAAATEGLNEAVDKIMELENAVVAELTGMAESVLAPLSGFIACIPDIEGVPDFPGASELGKLKKDINKEVSKRLNGEIANKITGDERIKNLTDKVDTVDSLLTEAEDDNAMESLKNKPQSKAVGVLASTKTGDEALSTFGVLSDYSLEDLKDWDTVKNFVDIEDQETFDTIVSTYLC